MAREPNDETDYQFNDVDDVMFEPEGDTSEHVVDEEVSPPADNTGKGKPAMRSRKILMFIAVLAILFGLYKLGSFFMAPKKTAVSLPATQKTQAALSSSIPKMLQPASSASPGTQATAPITAPAPTTSLPTSTTHGSPTDELAALIAATPKKSAATTTSPQTTDTVAAKAGQTQSIAPTSVPIKAGQTQSIAPTSTPMSGAETTAMPSSGQTEQQLLQATQQLHTATTTMQSNVSGLQRQISGLTQAIDTMQSNMKQMQQHLQNTQQLQKKLEAYRRVLGRLMARRARLKKQYFVQAVVPGRVWLRGADGTAVTVSVGDNLEGYGAVKSIDPYSGTVVTSSGVKLYYGLDDN